MNRETTRRVLLGTAALNLAVSGPGCAHTVPVDPTEIEELGATDWIQLQLVDGAELQLHAPRMVGDSLVGNRVLPGGRSGGRTAVAIDRIASLSVREGEGVRMVTGFAIVFGGLYALAWFLYHSGT